MHPPPGLESAVASDASIALAPTAVSAAISMATAVASAVPSESIYKGDAPEGECRLLGPFALIVQAALGGLALMSLVYKRWRERPQRPVKIWFFDVSKQVFGSVLVHIANVFMSMLTSGRFSVQVNSSTSSMMTRSDDDDYVPNPCSFYLLNLAIDTTIGIPILLLLLRVITGLARYTRWGDPPESIQSGNYGRPPNAWWWLKQSVIYFCGLFGMKICVLIIFLMFPWISKVGDWALGWTEGNEKLQIAFVMMIFPLIMNALQYYIIDSFIKLQESSHEPVSSDEPDERARRRYSDDDDETSRFRLVDHESGSESDDDETAKASRPQSKDTDEYDPNLDGDDRTVVGSSSSARNEPGKVNTELFPKE